MTQEIEKNMWRNLMMLVFGNPSKETMDGLSNIVNGGYDAETAVNMIDELVKKDATLSPLRNTYETARKESIDRVLEIIDEHISLLSPEFEGDCMIVVRLKLQDVKDEIEDLKGDEQGMTDKGNLCDTCANKDCVFQSGIIREQCDFYKANEVVNGFERR